MTALASDLVTAIGRGGSVALWGDPGIGKTRALTDAIDAVGKPTFAGGGLASLQWMPFLPLLRALRSPMPGGDHGAVAEYCLRRVRDGLLVLDDLHWSDPDTIEVLRRLGGRSTVLAAICSTAPNAARIRSILEAVGWSIVELAPLDDASAGELVRSLNPRLPEDRVAAIVATAAGNPSIVEALVTTPGDPAQMLDVAAEHLRILTPPARRALAELGLSGRPLPTDRLGPARGELLEIGAIAVDDGTCRVIKPFLVEAVVNGLAPDERSNIHSQLARTSPHVGEAARHHAEAGENDLALRRALEAASKAQTPGERARHLELAARSASPGSSTELRVTAAEALVEAGEPSMALRLLPPRSDDADDHPDEPGHELRAREHVARARVNAMLGRTAAARADLDAATAAGRELGDEVALTLALARARLESEFGDPEAALEAARAALAQARDAGSQLSRALAVMGTAQLLAGEPDWSATLTRAIDAAVSENDPGVEMDAAFALLSGHTLQGDATVAHELCELFASRAQDLLMLGWETSFRAAGAWLDVVRRGEYERAIRLCEELLDKPTGERTRRMVQGTLALSLADLGRFDLAFGVLGGAMVDPEDAVTASLLDWVSAEVNWLAGRHAEAIRAAGAAAARERGLPFTAFAVIVRAWAQFDAGTSPDELSSEVPDEASLEFDAVMDLVRGASLTDAEIRFSRAAEQWAPRQLRAQLRCLWGAGLAAARAGAPERAAESLLAVELRAQTLGLQPLLRRVQQSLRDVGMHRVMGADGPPTAGPLTARESEILRLVGEGCRTREIAARLAIGDATVETHIRSAMDKLGARTRVQAAILAREV